MFARREQKASYHWEKYSKPTYATVAALQPEDVVQKLITRKEDRVKTDPQSLLSPDIMLHLLKFFDKPEMCRMSCVSKKWRTFCGQKLLTKGIWNLKRHKEMLDGTAISYLIPKLQGVRELNLFRCKLSAANLSLLLYKCTALRKLDLSYTVCDHEESPGGGDDAKEQHTVSSPSSSSTSTRDGASSSIMTGRRKGRNRPTSSRSRMEEEKDEKQQHIGNDNGNDDVKEGKEMVHKHINLEVLNLRNSEVVEEDLKEEGLVKMLHMCPKLTALNLGMLSCVGSSTIQAIIDTGIAEKLSELHLNSCKSVSNKDLCKLSEACKNLKRVYLDMCSKITDEGISKVAKECPLEDFSLCAIRVSDASLNGIAQHCKNLRRLELSFCYLVSTDGVQEVAKGCQKLTHLNLCLVDMIQDSAIKTLSQHCKDLEELNLRGCTHITDASLECLSRNCKNLKVLHLLGCEKVSASRVAVLKQRIPSVKIIIW